MAKRSVPASVEGTDASPVKEAPVFPLSSLGITYDGKLRQWVVIQVTYNPETLEAGEVTKYPCGPTKDFAIERFKIMAVELDIIG